jgi:hypothetical protein
MVIHFLNTLANIESNSSSLNAYEEPRGILDVHFIVVI